jgi:uncharacterized cupredoxin-like copper-binding protein
VTRGRSRLAAGTLALVASALLAACSVAAGGGPRVEITMRYSHFEPTVLHVPHGQPITFVLRNADPIDHEWIVADAATHEAHRKGTEPHHAERPTEVSVSARTTGRTLITFPEPTRLTFICHLPGHEAYGMTGTLIVD